MPEHALLLSIRPKHAARIFDGTKTVELRRVRPRLGGGDLVLVYVSSPVKAMLGAFEVAFVVAARPAELWNRVKSKAALTRDDYDEYYREAKMAYGIFLKRKWTLDKPVGLEDLRERAANFRPPQSYHYMTAAQAQSIGLNKLLKNGRTLANHTETLSHLRDFRRKEG